MASGTIKAVASKADVDALNSKLIPVDFTLTFSNAITDLSIHAQNCWYNPATKEVHIMFDILSRNGLIPSANTPIATLPSAYKSGTTGLGFALVSTDGTNWQPPKYEACWMDSNGNIQLNNYILGNVSIYCLYINTTYHL